MPMKLFATPFLFWSKHPFKTDMKREFLWFLWVSSLNRNKRNFSTQMEKKKKHNPSFFPFFFSFLFFLLQMEITALVRLQRGQCGQVSSGLAGQKNICLQSTARPPHLCFSPEASPRLALITPFPKLTHTLVTVFSLSLSLFKPHPRLRHSSMFSLTYHFFRIKHHIPVLLIVTQPPRISDTLYIL